MGKLKGLTLAGLFGISLSYAGSFEDLKKLFEQKDIEINIAVTGDYLYTADRDDSLTKTDENGNKEIEIKISEINTRA